MRQPGYFIFEQLPLFWNKPEDIAVVSKFSDGRMMFQSRLFEQLHSFVIPLQKEYHVEFENDLIREVKSGDRKENSAAGKG
jgi:non-specific serine/threonine protein kinase